MTTQARELAGIISNAGDLLFDDDVSLQSDGAVLNFGVDSEVTLTHVADTGLLVNSTRQLQFGDSGTYINQSADGTLNITSDTEVEINATTVDINANVDISGNLVLGGNITIGDADSDSLTLNADLTSHLIPNATNTYDIGTASKEWRNAYFDGTVTSDAFAGPLTGDVTGNVSGTAATVTTAAQTNITSLGTLTTLTVDDITINGSTISDGGALEITSGDDLTIDVVGDIHLDADGGDVTFKDGGTLIGKFTNSSSDFVITAGVQDKDILFKGDDGGSSITPMTIDMSEGGNVAIGHTASLTTNFASKLQVSATDATGSLQLGRWTAGNLGSYLNFVKSRNGTIGSNTIVQDSDALGQIAWWGDDGADFGMRAGMITCRVDGTPGSDDMPGRLEFITTGDGEAFSWNNIRMLIDSSGDVLIGQTSQTGYTFAQKLVVGDGDANDGITIQSGSTHQGNLAFNHSDGTTAHGRILYQHNTNYMAFFTNNDEKIRFTTDGAIGIGGANYGTSGQAIVSGGSGAAVSWGSAGISTGKAIAMAMVFG